MCRLVWYNNLDDYKKLVDFTIGYKTTAILGGDDIPDLACLSAAGTIKKYTAYKTNWPRALRQYYGAFRDVLLNKMIYVVGHDIAYIK